MSFTRRRRQPAPAFPGRLTDEQQDVVDGLVDAYLVSGAPVTAHYVASCSAAGVEHGLSVLQTLPSVGTWSLHAWGYGFFTWSRRMPGEAPTDITHEATLRPTVAGLLASRAGAALGHQVLAVIAALAETARTHRPAKPGEPDYARFTQANAEKVLTKATDVPPGEFVELLQAEPLVANHTARQGTHPTDGWVMEVRPDAARLAYAKDSAGYVDGVVASVAAHNAAVASWSSSPPPRPWYARALGWAAGEGRRFLADVRARIIALIATAAAAALVAAITGRLPWSR